MVETISQKTTTARSDFEMFSIVYVLIELFNTTWNTYDGMRACVSVRRSSIHVSSYNMMK